MSIHDDDADLIVITGAQHPDGSEGINIIVKREGMSVSIFLRKEDILNLYHSLGNVLIRMQPYTTDNHIT